MKTPLVLLLCAMTACGEVDSQWPTPVVDGGTVAAVVMSDAAGAVEAVTAMVRVGGTYAMVSTTYTDGSTTNVVIDSGVPPAACDTTSHDLTTLDGTRLTICVAANLTCPQLPTEGRAHQDQETVTYVCSGAS